MQTSPFFSIFLATFSWVTQWGMKNVRVVFFFIIILLLSSHLQHASLRKLLQKYWKFLSYEKRTNLFIEEHFHQIFLFLIHHVFALVSSSTSCFNCHQPLSPSTTDGEVNRTKDRRLRLTICNFYIIIFHDHLLGIKNTLTVKVCFVVNKERRRRSIV